MTTPKQSGFKMPPEWHPHERCWMAWPCHQPTWEAIGLERAQKAYARVANAIAQFEPVTLLVNEHDLAFANTLCHEGVTLRVCPLDDSWLRDTGPTFLLDANQQLAGVDWMHNAWGNNYPSYEKDARIASFVIQHTRAKGFKAPLVMEGGSFHVDGEGTVLTSRECLLNANRNPELSQHDIEKLLNEHLGTEKIIWLNQGLVGDETDGHVDEIATFIGPAKVLCLITSDKADENYERLQNNLAILQHATDAKGRPLEVFTVEQPPATFLKGERLTLSYINFYVANGGIVMPAFGHEPSDTAALACFERLFPAHRILQIDALDVFAGGGGIHCITQQQPLSSQPTA